jgi:Domain of unknown function (DUF4331)
MKKLTLGLAALVAATCAVGLVGYNRTAHSADHLDSPAAKAEAAADVNDVYSWMDGNNMVLAMTVLPVAAATSKFSDKVQYVFHTTSAAKYGDPETKTDIICTFDVAQVASCWYGAKGYLKGDASVATGISSADSKFKVFAGPRSDPFFFNLDGFKKTVATVKSVAGGLTFNPAKCPAVDPPTSATLVSLLKSDETGAAAGKDFFKSLNGLAIVVSIDKTLVTTGGPIVSVWGSTNRSN